MTLSNPLSELHEESSEKLSSSSAEILVLVCSPCARKILATWCVCVCQPCMYVLDRSTLDRDMRPEAGGQCYKLACLSR